ncbi:MAG: N-acetylmuramoyl-L-alanine amidase [Planctomycetes bacterium]|nr:N-acetylmuramoyl-L-alanine amidase [Planctomycetota bacterium]
MKLHTILSLMFFFAFAPACVGLKTNNQDNWAFTTSSSEYNRDSSQLVRTAAVSNPPAQAAPAAQAARVNAPASGRLTLGNYRTSYPITKVVAQNFTVVVDPGHGGTDPGALGSGLRESDLTFIIGVLLHRKLSESGFRSTMTRWDDTFKSLENRVLVAKNQKCDLFVSIHINAAEATNACGVEVFHKSHLTRSIRNSSLITTSRSAAASIGNELKLIQGINWRGVKQDARHLYVLKQSPFPAVLVECGFISNANEGRKLGDIRYLDEISNRIYQGILSHYRSR